MVQVMYLPAVHQCRRETSCFPSRQVALWELLVASNLLQHALMLQQASSMIFGSGRDDFRAFESNMQMSFATMFSQKSSQTGSADSSQTVKDPYGTLIDCTLLY
jgi:hypothetical protein